MREEIPARISSEVRIQFSYKDGRAEDLDQLNQMLAAMALTSVRVEDLAVYLCTGQTLDEGVVVSTTYRCGLNSGVLICKKADGQESRRYQIATEVFNTGAMEGNAFADNWYRRYPARRLSMVFTYGFDTHEAFVVVYSEELAG